MVPGPWEFALLALAAFRLTRLIGWDVFPPVERVRDRVTRWSGEAGLVTELLACPFCLGAWISLAVYLAWWAAPRPTLAVATVAALSAVVGLVAKTLDA